MVAERERVAPYLGTVPGQDARLRRGDGHGRAGRASRLRMPDAPRGRQRRAGLMPEVRDEAPCRSSLRRDDATSARCTPRSRATAPDRCPKCGMKLVPTHLVVRSAGTMSTRPTSSTRRTASHGTRAATDWRARATTPRRGSSGKTTWSRSTGSRRPPTCAGSWSTARHGRGERRDRLALPRRRPGQDPPRQRDGLRPSDAASVPHPRRRSLPDPRPRRRRGAEPGLEGHGARPNRRDGRHPPRRHQPGTLDGALPHRRAPRERNDVQLPGGRRSAGAHEPATTHRSDRIHWMDRTHRGSADRSGMPNTCPAPAAGGAQHSCRPSRDGAPNALGTPEFHRSGEPGASRLPSRKRCRGRGAGPLDTGTPQPFQSCLHVGRGHRRTSRDHVRP